jgi:hypothetical protein
MWFWTMCLCFILAGTVPAIYDISKALRDAKHCEASK